MITDANGTRWINCPRCKGTGGWTSQHRDYGRLHCPEPGYTTEDCGECEGEGVIPAPTTTEKDYRS